MTPEQSKVLYQIEQKLNDMCKSNSSEHKEIKDSIKNIKDKHDDQVKLCDSKFEDRPTSGIFRWVIGGTVGSIIGGIITLSIIFGGISIQNRQDIKALDHEVKDHISYSVLVYEEITGKKWGQAAREDLEHARERYMETRKKALEQQEDIDQDSN